MQAERIIAGIMVKMAEEGLRIMTINQICERIKEYRSQGHDTSGISLQRVPDGLDSKEVKNFMRRLLTIGYVISTNPVEITPEGVDWLRKIAQL